MEIETRVSVQAVRMTFPCVGPFLQFSSVSLVACLFVYTKFKASADVFIFSSPEPKAHR